MRLAILADIKANETALNAVLAQCDQQRVDRIWIIGNLLNFGPDPIAVVDRLRVSDHRERCLVGHPDGTVLAGRGTSLEGFSSPSAQKGIRYLHALMQPRWWSGRRTRQRWEWLLKRPFQGMDGEWQFFSGTPQCPEADFLPIFAVEGRNEKLIPHFDVVRRGAFIGSIGRPGITFADTDLMEWQTISGTEQRVDVSGRKFIACPGSVGQPRDGDPRACFAIFDETSITWHRVAYDVNETIRRIHHAPYLSSYYADRIAVGR